MDYILNNELWREKNSNDNIEKTWQYKFINIFLEIQ